MKLRFGTVRTENTGRTYRHSITSCRPTFTLWASAEHDVSPTNLLSRAREHRFAREHSPSLARRKVGRFGLSTNFTSAPHRDHHKQFLEPTDYTDSSYKHKPHHADNEAQEPF